jgi:hypothetical protein
VHYEDFLAFQRTVSFQEAPAMRLIIEWFDREFPRRMRSLLHDQMAIDILLLWPNNLRKVY